MQDIHTRQKLMKYVERADAEPHNSLLQYAAGEIYLQMGDYALARKHFENVLRLEPGHVDSYRGLAICLVQIGHCETGLRMCFNLLRWECQDYIAKLVTAQAHIAFGLYDDAIEYYAEAARTEYEARNYMIWQYEQVSSKDKGQGKLLATAIIKKFPEYEEKFSNEDE